MWQRIKANGVLLVMVGMFVMLAGCGSTAEHSEGSAQPAVEAGAAGASSPSPTQAPEATTRIYKDDTGREVEIPTHPQRIVANYYIGDLLSLGVKPVGAAEQFFLKSSYLKDRLDGVESVGDNGGYNIEKILSLHPDLILINEFAKPEEVEKLSQVAPTVTVKYAGSDMYVHLNKVADIVGRTAEAQQWTDQYRAKAARIKEQLAVGGQQAETATVLQFMNKQVFAYFENISVTVYQTLGFAVPPKVKQMNEGNTTGYAKLSMEVLPDYSADRMFVIQPYDTLSDAIYKETLDSPLWKSLPAVQNHRVYTLDNKWNSSDPISMDAQLDDIVKLLLN